MFSTYFAYDGTQCRAACPARTIRGYLHCCAPARCHKIGCKSWSVGQSCTAPERQFQRAASEMRALFRCLIMGQLPSTHADERRQRQPGRLVLTWPFSYAAYIWLLQHKQRPIHLPFKVHYICLMHIPSASADDSPCRETQNMNVICGANLICPNQR